MKRSGFTLVETIIALFVTALALLTLQMGYQWVNNHQQQRNAEQLDWYGLLGIIEGGRYEFDFDHIDGDEAFVHSNIEKKDYIIRYRPNMDEVMLTTKSGGYVPLMQHVTDLKFTENNNHLALNMTTSTHQKFAATTIIGAKE